MPKKVGDLHSNVSFLSSYLPFHFFWFRNFSHYFSLVLVTKSISLHLRMYLFLHFWMWILSDIKLRANSSLLPLEKWCAAPSWPVIVVMRICCYLNCFFSTLGKLWFFSHWFQGCFCFVLFSLSLFWEVWLWCSLERICLVSSWLTFSQVLY